MRDLDNQKVQIPNRLYAIVSCGSCARDTRHKILASVDADWKNNDVDVMYVENHQIVQCQGCLVVSFREVTWCSDEWDQDPETGKIYNPDIVKLFPSRVSGRPLMSGVHHLPLGVYRIYQEAHSALCAELPILAGLGLRVIIEAICKDQGIKDRTLEKKIDALVDMGRITKEGSKILHALRFMGNTAAHETQAHTQQQINAGFNVVEHILQSVYVIPKESQILPSGSES